MPVPEVAMPPVPLATPPKVVEPLVIVRVCPPNSSEPLPANVVNDVPDVVPEMSSVPASITRADWAMLPAPVKSNAAPLAT